MVGYKEWWVGYKEWLVGYKEWSVGYKKWLVIRRGGEGQTRPLFECDDQSAMAALMVAEQNSFKRHVYLEQSYYLHGYWVILTDK